MLIHFLFTLQTLVCEKQKRPLTTYMTSDTYMSGYFSLLYFSFSNFGKIWVVRFYFDTLILLISYAKIHNSKISVSSMKNLKLWGILCINSTQFSAYETMSGPLQNHPCTLGTPRGILETVNQSTWMSSAKVKFIRSFWGLEQV